MVTEVDVEAGTEIAASAPAVWRVLTDFTRYAAWNPFIRRARGGVRVGDEVHVRVRSSLGVPLRFRATVMRAADNRELFWRGHVVAPWFACGEHWFSIEPIDGEANRVRFVQRERFSGLLPRLLAPLLAREARRGFEAMNEALALRAATRDATASPAAHDAPSIGVAPASEPSST